MATAIGYAAKREYNRRPADESFGSLAAMVESATHDKELSIERSHNWRDLRFAVQDDSVVLSAGKGPADLSHWSFSQACRSLEAPGAHYRDGLSPALAAECLNYRIGQAPHGQDARLLLRAPNGNGRNLPLVRACTSESYGRVWDADLYGSLAEVFASSSSWGLPMGPKGREVGAYRGDRDSFLIYINADKTVTDPSLRGGDGGMHRGLLVRNSEVGASSLVLDCILFRDYCRNQMLWGAMMDKSYRRRHVGTEVLRNAIREISRIAYQFTNQSAERDEAIIRGLINREIATTEAGVISELRACGATAEQAADAFKACEVYEAGLSPRSFWGAAQGLTRISQATEYQDERFALDSLAAKLMAKGRKLVAA